MSRPHPSLLALFVLSVLVNRPISAEPLSRSQADHREAVIRRVSNIAGVAGGVAVAGVCTIGFGLVGDETMFVKGAPPGLLVLDILPSAAVFAGTTWLALRTFTDVFLRREIRRWLSIPLGGVFGAVAGAAIGIAGFTTMFGIGQPLGIVSVGDATFGQVVFWSVLAGGLWGGLTGVIPGMVIGPAISFTMKY